MLDLRTLFAVHTMVFLAQSIALTFVWRLQKNYPPAKVWALGSILCSVGLLLLGARDKIPDVLSIVVANAILIPGWLIFCGGIAMAAGTKPPFRAGILVAVVAIVLIAWNSMVVSDLAARVAAFNSAAALASLYTAFACLKVRHGSTRIPFRLIGALSAILAASSLLAIEGAYRNQVTSLMAPSLAQIQYYFMATIFSGMVTSFLVLITAMTLQDKLDHEATHDVLTKALNRRALEEYAAIEWARVQRYDLPVSVVLVDIDHFKKLNDTYGHQAGDTALAYISDRVKAMLRPGDMWFRYGGEEFLAILPQTSGDSAAAVAQRLLEATRDFRVGTKAGPVSLTVSIGVAFRTWNIKTWHDLVHAADQALYKAKTSGRDRMVVMDGPQGVGSQQN